MKPFALLTVLAMTAIGLAGCADSASDLDGDVGSIDTGVDTEEFELAAGKGAIAGLLVDDRFRPIQLIDDPQTEFQTTGFVLLQETGQRVQTDENGEFAFVDLEPGRYTLRVTAAGHEATPQPLQVEEGVFNEINLVARRVASAGSVILTSEFSAFIPCAIAWPRSPGEVLPVYTSALVFGCLDASGESYRPGVSGLNYTGIDGLTFMVAEFIVDEDGFFTLQVRSDVLYANVDTNGGRYGRNVIANSEEVYDWPGNTNPWLNDKEFEAIIFYRGEFAVPTGDEDRVGASTSIRGKMLLSLFVGEPAVDVDSYQLLNEDSPLD